jgi:FkbM family methyltransferase
MRPVMEEPWEPPSTLEEKLRAALVPPRLRMRYLVARERLRGEAEIRLVPSLVDRRRIALDVGANKGVWAEVMRRYAAHVHAFEPNPKIFRELRRSAHRDVTAHRLALSNRSGRFELHIPIGRRGYSNQGGTLNERKAAISYGSVAVETRRLDEMNFGDIGFIKIDVEGHEMAVLEGAESTLRRCRPNLIIEIEEKRGTQPIAEALDAVCARGYNAFAMIGGRLKRVAEIDLARHHSQCMRREDYIYNWVFKPK